MWPSSFWFFILRWSMRGSGGSRKNSWLRAKGHLRYRQLDRPCGRPMRIEERRSAEMG